MGWWIAFLAGAATGVLSGFGIGGGTLLLIYMTAFAGVPQDLAQGINLLYFLRTAVAAWAATALDVTLLHRLFGAFLLYIGVTELFRKSPEPSQ